ncbi:MAG: DUF5666 domain-containing protein [Pseudomonadota bacterium]|nr:DUF5666 domain-containing protein [Pseudomonadota bacterium]
MSTVCRFISASLALVLVALSGCGGGGGSSTVAGIGGTGKIASGTITDFGSIWVNGVEYDIDNASLEVNDDDSAVLSQDDLRIGMVVTVTAVVEGSSGVASLVVYDNEIEGPVSGLTDPGNGLTKSFSVIGVDVIVDSAGTEFDDGEAPGFSFATIANDDVVEISGFIDGSNILNATYIKKTDDFLSGGSEVEFKGTADAGTDAGAGDSFTLDGVTVNIRADADLSEVPDERVTGAMFVEVEGMLTNDSPLTIDAFRIEQEEDGLEEDAGEAELEGFVSDFADNSNFRVDGQLVDASNAEFEPAGLVLSDGMKVEVEGTIEGGILNARKVEQED